MTTYLELGDALYVTKALGLSVTDAGLLGSAMLRPSISLFGVDIYPTIEDKAAALVHSIAKNHALVDGNKRTTWTLMVAFLFQNGYKHNFTEAEGMDFVLGIATDELSSEQAAEMIRQHLVPLS
jgi:death-on-curing protein